MIPHLVRTRCDAEIYTGSGGDRIRALDVEEGPFPGGKWAKVYIYDGHPLGSAVDFSTDKIIALPGIDLLFVVECDDNDSGGDVFKLLHEVVEYAGFDVDGIFWMN